MSAASLGRIRTVPRRVISIGVGLVLAALTVIIVLNVVADGSGGGAAVTVRTPVPHSDAMETALGIRFSRIAVVGDGGLITASYVVLDAQKATEFQSDITHPPVIASESRRGSTHRVSLMRQGHNLRDGQTYYLVYQDTHGAIRSGERVTLTKGGLELAHFPVL